MAVSSAANSDTFKVTTPSECEIRLTRAVRCASPPGVRGDEQARAHPAVVGPPRRRLFSSRVRGRSPPGRRVALRRTAPEGRGGAFYGVYREIAPPERVVFTEIFEPFPDGASVVTAVLTEENGKTRLTVSCVYPSLEVRDMVLNTGMARARPSATTGSRRSHRSSSDQGRKAATRLVDDFAGRPGGSARELFELTCGAPCLPAEATPSCAPPQRQYPAFLTAALSSRRWRPGAETVRPAVWRARRARAVCCHPATARCARLSVR